MMKKTAAFLVFLLFLASLSSCNAETVGVENTRYLFLRSRDALWRYDAVTGEATVPCGDPLCAHNTSSCLFYHISEIAPDNEHGCVYYIKYDKDSATPGAAVYRYEIETGNSTQLYHTEDFITYLSYVLGYAFFHVFRQENAGGDENAPVEYSLYAVQDGKNKASRIDDGSLSTQLLARSIADGRVTWFPMDGTGPYSTTPKYRDKRSEPMESTYAVETEEYGYLLQYKNNGAYTLNCENKTDGARKVLLENIAGIRFLDQKMLYVRLAETPRIIGAATGNSDQVYDDFDYELRIIDLAGENDRLLCTLPEDVHIALFGRNATNAYCVGKYEGFPLCQYQFEKDGTAAAGFSISDQLLIVDTETGEWRLSHRAGENNS